MAHADRGLFSTIIRKFSKAPVRGQGPEKNEEQGPDYNEEESPDKNQDQGPETFSGGGGFVGQ